MSPTQPERELRAMRYDFGQAVCQTQGVAFFDGTEEILNGSSKCRPAIEA